MKYRTLGSKGVDRAIPEKRMDDLVQPLFVAAKSVENLRRKRGSSMDKEVENTLSDLEKSIADMLDTLDKLRMS